MRGSYAFIAGLAFASRTDRTTLIENEAWYAQRVAAGFTPCWLTTYKLVRIRYPDELLGETTIEGQGRALGAWVVEAFNGLADNPPSP